MTDNRFEGLDPVLGLGDVKRRPCRTDHLLICREVARVLVHERQRRGEFWHFTSKTLSKFAVGNDARLVRVEVSEEIVTFGFTEIQTSFCHGFCELALVEASGHV